MASGSPSSRPLRALAAIVDLPVRVGAVGDRAREAPETFVASLESLLAVSRPRTSADADAMLACALWLLDEGDACIPQLQGIAVRGGYEMVAAMLTGDAPHRALAAGGRLAELGIPETARVQRQVLTGSDWADGLRRGVRYPTPPGQLVPPGPPLSLAEYEEYFASLVEDCHAARGARTAEPLVLRPLLPWAVRRQVGPLARHQSAFTIGRLLDEPSILPRDVVAIAARRPTTPAIVRQLTSRLRWMQLPGVRAALAANPFTPTRTALILTPTCRPRLRALASSNVHPRVRELARRLGA